MEKQNFVYVNKHVRSSVIHPFTAAVSNDPLPTSSSNNLERWLDEDVRLLITTWAEHKHMFGSKATKKEVFDKIAEQFRKDFRSFGHWRAVYEKVGKDNLKTKGNRRSQQENWKFRTRRLEMIRRVGSFTKNSPSVSQTMPL